MGQSRMTGPISLQNKGVYDGLFNQKNRSFLVAKRKKKGKLILLEALWYSGSQVGFNFQYFQLEENGLVILPYSMRKEEKSNHESGVIMCHFPPLCKTTIFNSHNLLNNLLMFLFILTQNNLLFELQPSI